MPSQAYPKSLRMTRKSEIDLCYRSGRRWSAKLLRIHARPNGLEVSRLAISVPGRLCPSVQRNRWKRMIREAFRLNRESIGPGLDVIVVPSQPPGDLRRQQVEAVLIELLRRVREKK